jgi:hypothetical protein
VWRWLLLILFLPVTASALVNLAGTCTEDGGYKMARQDQNGCTATTRIWNGTSINLFGGKGEVLTWATYLLGGNSDATNVMVQISSFTGTGTAAGTGFSAITVSSSNVWDYTGRPYSLYLFRYLQQVGMPRGNGAWDPSEYEERQVATRWQVPYTVNGNNNGIPNGTYGTGTYTFLNRADANKFYPDPKVPIEEFAASSFTVSASSSQAIGGEVNISTGLIAGATYTALLTVYEGTTVSTTIPINLYVYNFTMPTNDAVPVIGYVGNPDLNMRLTGTRFPSNQFVDPYLTNHLRVAAFLHRHRILELGDQPPSTQDYPSIEYQKHIDGSAFTSTYGYGNGPNPGIGDSMYILGAYGNWISANWSTTTVTGAGGYCTNVSSWVAYAMTSGVNVQQYTSNDEAATMPAQSEVNTLSTLNRTNSNCAFSGLTLPWFQTGNLPEVQLYAPNVQTVVSADWIHASSNTWQQFETAFSTTTGLTAAAYNSEVPGTDSFLNIMEQGIGPVEVILGDYKYGQKFHFLWSLNYWNDGANGGQAQNGWNANTNNDNDMFNISKNYGYDLYPATDAARGHSGPGFSNGDGNMLYPATDAVYGTPNYGFNGVIGSWRLDMTTRGIQLADVAKMAAAINPTATQAIINGLIQNAMWTNACVTLVDCSYIYGPRPWDETENDWEVARESLEQIVSATTPTPPPASFTSNVSVSGGIQFNGVTIQ